MKAKLIHYKSTDPFKKKITVITLWIFVFCSPLFVALFVALLSKLGLQRVQGVPPYLYLIGIYTVAIGILFRIKISRLLAVFMFYSSLALILAAYIEKSLRLYSHNEGCFTQFLGYGIDYNSLIYPEKILAFWGGLFLIIVIHFILIYIFSNKESLKLFSLSKKYFFQETIVLTSICIILFSGDLWFLINKNKYTIRSDHQYNPSFDISKHKTSAPRIKLPTPPPLPLYFGWVRSFIQLPVSSRSFSTCRYPSHNTKGNTL
jgi:hypothetical protein